MATAVTAQTSGDAKDDNDNDLLIEFFKVSKLSKVNETLNKGIDADFVNWNIFELNNICHHNTLLICAHYLFMKLNLYQTLNINQNKFLLFLYKIESGYLNIPYHNSLHATDVMINAFHYLIKSNLILSDLDKMIILISAACHDYKHPGFSSNFLIQTNHDISLKYKNKIPLLESMHSNEAIQIVSNKKYNSFLENFNQNDIKYIKECMNEMILGTAPENHKSHVESLTKLIDITKNDNDISIINNHKKDIMIIALHCSDVGSVCKIYNIFEKWWIELIHTEWLAQGDKEQELKLNDTWRMMDRSNMDKIPLWHYEFMTKYFQPLHQKWALLFPSKPEYLVWYNQSIANYGKLKQQGFGNIKFQ